MSTFNGIIKEFPGIRVDFFRGVTEDPPLACFVSHIHSDHLAGLETYNGRPVYCSAATRAMLLKLQRKASRINFDQGILEKQDITYKHQKRRLKSLPMETPTEIELEPNNSIRVTLFDANHCPGAVMFLFEGTTKAVLYTGDIRSEPWHINALTRSPCLIEYSSGLKILDKIYLDTSFTEDVDFQTKAEGLRELIEKVSRYPKDTTFYLSAWTYGYEEVWIALAKALNTQIHVDEYKMTMYQSLQVKLDDNQYIYLSPEAPALTGFACGNRYQPGLLTRDDTVRLHSCEKGTMCSTIDQGNIVWITPIVAHLSNNSDMVEVGIGGGVDDLEQKDELVLTPEDACVWLESVNKNEALSKDAKESLQVFLLSAMSAQHPMVLKLKSVDGKEGADDMEKVLLSLLHTSKKGRGNGTATTLPNRIKFPYSRHSSYRELCHLVRCLGPKDIWPCTVETVRWIKEGITIKGLFGEYCSGDVFDHDEHMAQVARVLNIGGSEHNESQTSVGSFGVEHRQSSPVQDEIADEVPANNENIKSSQETTASLHSTVRDKGVSSENHCSDSRRQQVIDLTPEDSGNSQDTVAQHRSFALGKRAFGDFDQQEEASAENNLGHEDGQIEEGSVDDNSHLFDSQETTVSARALEARRTAFNAMLDSANPVGWAGLLSTTNHHTRPESELGEG